VRQPEEFIPGRPLYYATAMPLSGVATGVLVESHMGRPTKVEGNPEHPASLGATDVFAQASVLTLYDPDRSQVVSNAGRISTWSAFLNAVRAEVEKQRVTRGAGLRILTETVTSPALAAQIRALLAQFPAAKWHQYEAAGRHTVRAGAQLAFGEYVDTRYDFSKADVVLSLDADFLTEGPGHLRYTREFMARRRVRGAQGEMNRLYAIESTPSNTGTVADHVVRVKARDVETLARAAYNYLRKVSSTQAPPSTALREHEKWIQLVDGDLLAHFGKSLVIAGERQSPAVHAIAHAMNAALGNVGQTVFYTEPVEAHPVDQFASLRDLVHDMYQGRVKFLLILGGNPVYTTPADIDFRKHLQNVPLRAHAGLYEDETSAECQWHVPEAHYLEAWGDTRAFDGTITIQQPLIAPLYGGKSHHETLAALTDNPSKTGYEFVREYWRARLAGDFENAWRRAVHDGMVPGTAAAPKKVALQPLPPPTHANPDSLGTEVIFRPDPCLYDGQFANNGWLQELPKPLTKLVWDNAAMLSDRMATQLRARNEDMVELKLEGRTVRAPVFVTPGHPHDSITLYLGHGRTRGGRVATGHGCNAGLLRTSASPWVAAGLTGTALGHDYKLTTTQHHHSINTRDVRSRIDLLVRESTLAEYNQNPKVVQEMEHLPSPLPTLYPPHPYEGHAWGLAVDLNACTGCNSCVIACQAENNIPVVGKKEVERGREMHWLRIDRYYKGGLDDPETVHQPVMCQHCENAPCETVCPVAATVHSDEGLNDMVYNRCVGTRYCSNNCPYKVRRFNFFQYQDYETPVLHMLHNPDVTVRSRGVMEKCTYCVQRINSARIEAARESRPIRDGEVVTACQQVCPAEAIVFGDINDKSSRVSRLRAESLNYGILTELNTRPRTTYLAKLKNPNPEMPGTSSGEPAAPAKREH
jgi:molybdopterin-containing oxidoreductase family iron-sulfur binding subunit